MRLSMFYKAEIKAQGVIHPQSHHRMEALLLVQDGFPLTPTSVTSHI